MSNLNGENKRFDEFEVDLARRRLLRDGKPVTLKPKAFDLLAVMVENNGKLLSKEDLFRSVWDDQIVEESNLTVSISAIRRALGETASDPKYITNVSGRGYYFNAELIHPDANDLVIESHTVSRLVVELESDGSEPVEESEGMLRSGVSVFRRYQFAVAASLVFVLVACGGFLFLRRSAGSGFNSFEKYTIKRLTTSGKAVKAAMSPDGKLFVFSQDESDGRQSLWLGQVEGGDLLQLRSPIDEIYGNLTFTPNSDRIYFQLRKSESDKFSTVYRMPAFGGVPEKIRENAIGEIAFSHDGKQMCTVRAVPGSGTSAVVIVPEDGSGDREITSRPVVLPFSAWTIAWSPDDQLIAISARVDESDPNVSEVFTMSTADGKIDQLTDLKWRSIKSLEWQSDSNGLIAVAAKQGDELVRELWSISYPKGEARRVVTDLSNYYGTSISKKGDLLLSIQAQYFSNIWVAPSSDLAAAKQVTFDMLGRQTGWSGLDWLPDNRIVYTSAVGASETIWEMNADGSGQKQVILEGGTNNYVSTDEAGRFLVFESNRSGGNDIWRSNIDGSDLRQLTETGNATDPHISPNGEFVIYSILAVNKNSLWRIRIDGSEKTQIIPNGGILSRFSPDNKIIATVVYLDRKYKVALIPADGGEPTMIFDTPQNANLRLGIHWTPDGKTLTYRDWKNGIWQQDIKGGEPKRLEGLPNEKLYAFGWSRDGKQFAFTRGTVIRDVVILVSTN